MNNIPKEDEDPKAKAFSDDDEASGQILKDDTVIKVERILPSSVRSASDMLLEATRGENVGGRKLTFHKQCAAFAALYAGVRNQVVARAFGISAQTASFISGCLENDPEPYRTSVVDKGKGIIEKETIVWDHNRNRSPNRRRHYEEVAREFDALGKERFAERYYTERVHDLITVAKHELHAEHKARDRARRGG